MKIIKIGYKNDTQPNKPIVWIDAGIHAREWIAPATALYIANKVLIILDVHNINLFHILSWSTTRTTQILYHYYVNLIFTFFLRPIPMVMSSLVTLIVFGVKLVQEIVTRSSGKLFACLHINICLIVLFVQSLLSWCRSQQVSHALSHRWRSIVVLSLYFPSLFFVQCPLKFVLSLGTNQFLTKYSPLSWSHPRAGTMDFNGKRRAVVLIRALTHTMALSPFRSRKLKQSPSMSCVTNRALR